MVRIQLALLSLLFINQITQGKQIIDGYTDKTSYYPGEICEVYLNSETKGQAIIRVFDINGNVASKFKATVYPQDTNKTKPWELGFGYKISAEFKIPNLESGFYLIENEISFIVKTKDDKPITLVYPSNTINAYNNAGGKSLYGYNSTNKTESNKVTFLRPTPFGDKYGSKEFYRWIDSKFGNKVKYICDRDLDIQSSFKDSKVLIIPGHNEYWTRKARLNFDDFIDSGGHSAIFSGNTMWWQVRYESSGNKMICYRKYDEDPVSDTHLKTVTWTNKELDYPIIKSIGANFDNGGFGKKQDKGFDGYKIVNPNSPLLENTGLEFGDVLNLPTTEYDGAPISGYTKDSIPILDSALLGFHKIELIGYDYGIRTWVTVPTFIVFKKTNTSGIIINVCSTEWCSNQSMRGRESSKFKKISINIIKNLLYDINVFSETKLKVD